MPIREEMFATGEMYHIFNRGVNGGDIFYEDREFKRMLMVMNYYQFEKPDLRLSYYLAAKKDKKMSLRQELESKPKIVQGLGYCLMTNHYHLLVKQLTDGGIVDYLSKIQDSYSRYFNRKNGRSGPLFTGRFRAVRIESELQLIHVVRYIHLNPYSAGIVKRLNELGSYKWSSYGAYLNGMDEFSICDPTEILSLVGGRQKYEDDVVTFADFEREYKLMKKQLLDAGI